MIVRTAVMHMISRTLVISQNPDFSRVWTYCKNTANPSSQLLHVSVAVREATVQSSEHGG